MNDAQIQVWPVAGGFHATGNGMPVVAYGVTREAAIQALREDEQRLLRLGLMVAAGAQPAGENKEGAV